MAKDIKAIQCPKCGSIYKLAIKPDFYRCQNCQTEYFLDSDDVHIYHHHERVPPLQSSAPSGNIKLPVYILIGAVAFIAVAYFTAMLFQPKKTSYYNAANTYKAPRMYYSSYVYTNTATGNPVYLRMGTDYIDKGNNKSEQELHAQFNDAVNGKLLADRIITDEYLSKDRCSLTFKTYPNNLTYAIGCNTILLQLDTRNNRLVDVTKGTFKDFPQLSSGVAKLDFDYSKAMINVMNNEGESYHYFPTIKKLVNDEGEADTVWKKQYNQHYFEFGYMGDYFDQQKEDQLIEVKYFKQAGQNLKRNLTPGRKYFNPKILYQDNTNLLIVVNTTAAPDPPVSIQRIDVQTGKVLWALPPDRYDLYSAAKWKQGFAVEYRKDEEADYVHGVMVVSDAGKLIHNYQLSRTE